MGPVPTIIDRKGDPTAHKRLSLRGFSSVCAGFYPEGQGFEFPAAHRVIPGLTPEAAGIRISRRPHMRGCG